MKTSRLLIVAATALLGITACKPQHTNNEKIKIVIWTTYNDTYQAVLNNAIDDFQKSHPNVVVDNIKQQGSYQEGY